MFTTLFAQKLQPAFSWLWKLPLDLLIVVVITASGLQAALMLLLPWPLIHAGLFCLCATLACFAGWRYEIEGDVIRFMVLHLAPLLVIFAMLIGSSLLCFHLYKQPLDLKLVGALWSGITLAGWFYFGGIISRGPDD
jgi:hypothetical protein